jgi:hypothetical protein
MIQLRKHECGAWMVAYAQAREEALRRGMPHGAALARSSAEAADAAIQIMREREASE